MQFIWISLIEKCCSEIVHLDEFIVVDDTISIFVRHHEQMISLLLRYELETLHKGMDH